MQETITNSQSQKEKKLDLYIDKLISIMENIPLGKVTILTGGNGKGKSMIRRLLPQFLPEVDGKETKVASVSMDLRAGLDPSRFSGFDRDCEWISTSENTLSWIEGVMKSEDRFIILDEIEIGMGEEVQAGLCISLNAKMPYTLENNRGILVITHSRTIVKWLKHDVFINLEGMSEEEWLNREIIPVLPGELKADSRDLFEAFQKRLKKNE